jgi:hypothetical protein
MKRKQSKALLDFRAWMREANRIAKISDSADLRRLKVSDSLLCSALFLSFARFETFLKDLASEMLNQILAKHKYAFNFPGLITASHLSHDLDHAVFKNFYASENHRVFLDSLQQMLNDNKFQWSNPSNSSSLSVDAIQQGISYPKPDNIASLFHRLGVENIFTKLNKSLKGTSKNSVKWSISV